MASGIDSFSEVLKRLYTADAVRDLVNEPAFFGVTRTAFPTRLAGCNLDAVHAQAAGVGIATVTVVTTVVALEWLRRRKAAVAAAEGDSGAFDGLVTDFVAWFRGWLEGLRRVFSGEHQSG